MGNGEPEREIGFTTGAPFGLSSYELRLTHPALGFTTGAPFGELPFIISRSQFFESQGGD